MHVLILKELSKPEGEEYIHRWWVAPARSSGACPFPVYSPPLYSSWTP